MLKHDDKTGLVYREELKELFVIREQSQYKKLNFKNSTFMDIGAHIGATTNLALESGAKKCISYEPMPETFEILKQNVGGRAELNQKAVIIDNQKEIDFYIHHKYHSCNSILPIKNCPKITVSAVNFLDELHKHQPNIVKIDCEGGEFFLLEKNILPDFVEELAVEIHINKKEKKQKAFDLMLNFKDWYVHKKFRFNWYITTAIIKRHIPSELGTVQQYMEGL